MLADFDLKKCINEQIDFYLKDTSLTCSQLKSILVNKKPITLIQIRIETLLEQSKDNNIKQIKSILEKQMYKKQIQQDEHDAKKDNTNNSKDERLKARFNQELNKISNLIERYKKDQNLLIQKTNWLYVPQTQHLEQSPLVEQLQNQIQQYDIKIHYLFEKKRIIEHKLVELEYRLKLSKLRQVARAERAKARIAYENTEDDILLTLSEKNKQTLNQSLQEQTTTLEKKCKQLSLKAELMQFNYLIIKLTEHLSRVPLLPNESTAITAVLKLMKQHQTHHADTVLLQKNIQKKNAIITPLIARWHSLRENLKKLNTKNPALIVKNELLEKDMQAAMDDLKRYNILKRNLGMTIWLLLGLTLLFTIPLILALSGAISFTNPLLLYCLVIIPPVALLATTISVGIATYVYYAKAINSNHTIVANQTMLAENIKKMGQNGFELAELELINIPSLETQIKKEEAKREEFQIALEQTQKQKDLTLAQAKEINPVTIKKLSLFNPKRNAEGPIEINPIPILTPQ